MTIETTGYNTAQLLLLVTSKFVYSFSHQVSGMLTVTKFFSATAAAQGTLPSIFMKTFILIIQTFIFVISLSGQVRPGIYQHLETFDTSLHTQIILNKNHTFYFYDNRHNSCFLWVKFNGDWKQNKDTLIFSWTSKYSEERSNEKDSVDHLSDSVTFTFRFDDNEPIENVKVCYTHDQINTCKYSFTDRKGQIKILKEKNYNKTSFLSEEGNAYVTYSADTKFRNFNHGGIVDTTFNVFIITIKKKIKSSLITSTNKYVLVNDTIFYADKFKDDIFLNWGNYKFVKKNTAGNTR